MHLVLFNILKIPRYFLYEKEHYDHVVNKYELTRYHDGNVYLEGEDNKIDINNLSVEGDIIIDYSIDYSIDGAYREEALFVGIPTKELAEEILQYIKDTEILFV